jgi:hypothetical protein
MPIANVFKTSTSPGAVTDGSQGSTEKPGVSDFLTVQAFTNFAAMSGAITAAWHATATVLPQASGPWFPYACSLVWAVVSYQTSKDGLAPPKSGGSISCSLGHHTSSFIHCIREFTCLGWLSRRH